MNINNLKKYNWEKYWAGNWSFLTSCYFGYYYTQPMKRQMGEKLNKTAIITRKGYTFCYFDHNDRKKYGEFIGTRIGYSKTNALEFCSDLKKRADKLVEFAHRLMQKKVITQVDYNAFIAEFLEYSGPHISVRHTVDFLPPKKLQSVLSIFQEVRLYVEKVYAKTEEFMVFWAKQTGKKEGLNWEFILCCTPDEIDYYWKKGQLPKTSILKKRFELCGALFFKNGFKVLIGGDVVKIEKLLQKGVFENQIKGQTAYPGKAIGLIKIIFNPTSKEAQNFKKRDILVTGMTRPEFIPLIKKAGAVVTDAGGILSHAAITARELKITTIIGTGSATKVFNNGDMVEVDANKGIIRKIK